MPTEAKVIMRRLAAAWDFMQPLARKAERAGVRYLDPSRQFGIGTVQDARLRDLPVGEVNYMAINIRQKIARIAISSPDFYVVTGKPENAPIVRAFLSDTFRAKHWTRRCQQALLFRFLCGMGFLPHIWHPIEGAVLECAHPRDLLYDPHTHEATWRSPRYAARRVWLPREEALARYGARALAISSDSSRVVRDDEDGWEDGRAGVRGVGIWVYWDAETEAEVMDAGVGEARVRGVEESAGARVLRIGPNIYGKVPIHVIQGDINPEGNFSLGDYDLALGTFEMLRRLQNVLNKYARNGGGVPWYRSEYIDDADMEQYLSGEVDGPLKIAGAPGEAAIGFTENQPLNESLIMALQYIGGGLDADQGVNDMDRGVLQQQPRFATQVGLLAERSSTRGVQARIQYEHLLEEIARETVRLHSLFGLDPAMGPPTEEQVILWEALQDVEELRIVEETTAFRDPAVEQQQAMQLLQLAISLQPLMEAQGVRLNLRRFLDDALRASNRRNTADYYMEATSPAQDGTEVLPLPQEEEHGTTE